MKRALPLLLLTLAAIIRVFLLPPIAQSPAYHQFCDRRIFLGIPNFANTVSNAAFVLVALRGFVLLKSPAGSIRLIYSILFIGILLTGLGSAWYHLHPNNDSLVFDRLPMTIIFMSLLAATLSESAYTALAIAAVAPLLLLGMGSVLWWRYTESMGRGDLRPYILVQYSPPLLIIAMQVLYPTQNNQKGRTQLLLAVITYAIAKLFDVLDCPIYTATATLSGHTLKHLAAALSTWYLTQLFRKKHLDTAAPAYDKTASGSQHPSSADCR